MIMSRWVFLLWMAAMGCSLWYLAETLSVRNDLGDLLLDGKTDTQQVLLSQVRQGLSGRLILLAVEGAPPEELVRLSRSLAEAIRADGTIGIVANGMDSNQETERLLIERYRYLLSPAMTAETFSVAALRTSLEQRLDDLRSPLGILIKDLIPVDPTGETWRILQTWSGSNGPTMYRGVWMAPDRTRALLMVATKGSGFDVDVQESIQAAIRALFDQVVKQNGLQAQLRMSGPGVFAVEVQRAIESEAWQLSVVASVLVVGLLYVSYRSLMLVVLSLIPILTAVVIGVLVVNYWFGFVHGVTLGFGITLLGIVDDYPIHLFSHLSGHESAGRAMQIIWPTMRLGMLTTVIGFSALLLSGYQALAQLGLLAIVGLVAGALVTRWVVPACIGSRFLALVVPRHLVSRFDLLSKGQVVAATVLLLATVVLFWSDTPMWEQDVARLSPVPEDKKQFDQQLRHELGVPDVRDLLVVEGATVEELLEKAEVVAEKMERLRANGTIRGYDVVSRYIPSQRTQLERQRLLPERAVLERNLAEALKGLPFAPGLFAPFVEAVQASRFINPIGLEAFTGTMIGIKVESFLFSHKGRWMTVAPLSGIEDRQLLVEAVHAWGDPSIRYVDLKEESNRVMTAYRDRTVWLLGCGIVAIGVVLAVGLKSVTLVARVLAPVLAALLVVTAILRGVGEPLSFFHVATFLLVVGLGLDYALFLNRPECEGEERLKTNFGLLVCSGTTMLVFGVLAISKTPALHAIGVTAASGALCCLLFAPVVARRASHAI